MSGVCRRPPSSRRIVCLAMSRRSLIRMLVRRTRACNTPGRAWMTRMRAGRIRARILSNSLATRGGGTVPERSHVLNPVLPRHGARLSPVCVRCGSGNASRAREVRGDVGGCVQHRTGGRAPRRARQEGAAAADPAVDPREHRCLGVHVVHDGRTQDAVGVDLRPRSGEAHCLEGSEDLLRVDEDQQREPGTPRRPLCFPVSGGMRRTSSTREVPAT